MLRCCALVIVRCQAARRRCRLVILETWGADAWDVMV